MKIYLNVFFGANIFEKMDSALKVIEELGMEKEGTTMFDKNRGTYFIVKNKE